MNHIFFSSIQKMKYSILVCCVAILFEAKAQNTTLTLEQCYDLAISNYPLIQQKELLIKTKEYNIDNASKGNLPQISLNGQITYQSEVTKFPFVPPGQELFALSKDQYKGWAEIIQPLNDGYIVKQQKHVIEANTAVEEQKIEVELYKLKERVNQVFFSILLIHEQIKQVDLLKKDIQSGIEKTNVAIANGIALKSEADVLKAELLKSDQKTIELKANLEGYVQVLSLLIHQPVDENTKLVTPPVQVTEKTIHRPELILYDVQYQSLEAQRNILTGMNKPKIGLFLQGGYGRPALNFLDNRFDFYYIGGLKFNWLISNRYTYKNDNQIIALNQFQINAQRETFLFNTNVSLTQQESEISKLHELIVVDDQIIDLYENIKNSYEVQLQNGIITSTDYLTHVNAIDVARQNQVLHHVQLLMTQYNYKTTSGN